MTINVQFKKDFGNSAMWTELKLWSKKFAVLLYYNANFFDKFWIKELVRYEDPKPETAFTLIFQGNMYPKWNNQKVPNVSGLPDACEDGHKDSDDRTV